MELRGYNAMGDEIWSDEVLRIEKIDRNTDYKFKCHLASGKVAWESEASLDKFYPGWRDLLGMEIIWTRQCIKADGTHYIRDEDPTCLEWLEDGRRVPEEKAEELEAKYQEVKNG